MSMTLEELKERLKHLDEVSLLELLAVDSDQLVEAFSILIEDNYEFLEDKIGDYL